MPEQLAKTREFATVALRATIVEEIPEAVSGRDPTANRLRRLRSLAESGRITDICFSSTDRAFRKSHLGQTFFEDMGRVNVHVWIDGDCVAHASATERLTSNMKLAVAEHEVDVLIERGSKRATYASRGTTYLRQAPFGFTIVAQKVTR